MPAPAAHVQMTHHAARADAPEREGTMPARSSLCELFGDLVVYRDLDPLDARLPRFETACAQAGLSGAARPRKHEMAYAQTMVWFLEQARALEMPGTALHELVYLGDTVLSDGGAFRNLRTAGGWQGWAFIGAERDEALAVSEQNDIYTANRWTALADFVPWMLAQGANLNAHTAVIIDIDKTALGARGRNDGVIDRARVVAIEATIAEVLGATFDQAGFRRAYVELNQSRYHAFTADNQDYVAYACLMLGAGICSLEDLRAEVAAGRLPTAQHWMAQVNARRDQLPSQDLRSLHDDIYQRVRQGDPTPFKSFRRREYLETTARMGNLPDNIPLAQRLVEEICLTQEVMEVGRWLRARDCLVMALSDKPDEATMPSPGAAAQGHLPLHRTITHVVGRSIAHRLPAGGAD
jgi:hypothetical protein